MDYLEGILLHAWWSDTDYETRKHTGTWLWFSIVSFLALVGVSFALNYYGNYWVSDRIRLWQFFTISIFLLSPFLCMLYYRLPFVFRLPILAVLLLKYVSAFFWAIASLSQFFIIPEWITFNSILNWGNETFGNYLENTTAEMGVSGLFFGGAVVAVLAILIAIIIAVLAIVIPIFMLKVFNLLQFFWDRLFIWIFAKLAALYRAYKSDPSQGKFLSKEKNPETKKTVQSKVEKVSRRNRPLNER